MKNTLTVERFSGAAILPYLPELARLRITVFREFPYLYDGCETYEQKYLHTYTQSAQSVMVIVRDGTHVVGASSGLPLSDETPDVQRPFITHSYPLETIFYFGESVLLPNYRNQGLGVRFFLEREAHVAACGHFKHIAFCAVERPADHPRRPPHYIPLDPFWKRRGYYQQPHLHTTFSWQDLDESSESPKKMVFWIKTIRHEKA